MLSLDQANEYCPEPYRLKGKYAIFVGIILIITTYWVVVYQEYCEIMVLSTFAKADFYSLYFIEINEVQGIDYANFGGG